MEDTQAVYANRFSPDEIETMQKVWQVLVERFFRRYLQQAGAVLDFGGGFCGFINNVQAVRRIVIDKDPAVRRYAAPGVEVMVNDDLELSGIRDGELTHVFISNLLEHLRDGVEVLALLRAVRRKLIAGGSLMVLQPNFRYTGAAYFDYIDHRTVLTDRSLKEAAEASGFEVTRLIERFLPYTSKHGLPGDPVLVRLYLACPVLWRFFGQQTFMTAEKPVLDNKR